MSKMITKSTNLTVIIKVYLVNKMRGRAFRTQIDQSTFFVLTILCLGGYEKQARAFRTQIGLNEKYVVKNATS